MKSAADGAMNGVLEFSADPLVSVDIVGNPHSCIFDSGLTVAMGNTVKVFGWYDNEAGQLPELANVMDEVALQQLPTLNKEVLVS